MEKQWEYLYEEIHGKVQQELNERGKQGRELIQVIGNEILFQTGKELSRDLRAQRRVRVIGRDGVYIVIGTDQARDLCRLQMVDGPTLVILENGSRLELVERPQSFSDGIYLVPPPFPLPY